MAVTIKELFECGVHFGHRTQRWNPKMKPYIFEARNGIYLINLEHTFDQLREACNFVRSLAKKGEKILFVGCKKAAQEAVREYAGSIQCPHVSERWLGGTLTNLSTIRKSVKRLEYIEGIEKNGEMAKLPKQEASVLRREKERMLRNLGGIRNMERIPSAMFIIDTVRELNALTEARRLHIPTLALVDTNADPTKVDYPIAGNDDAMRSIRVILEALTEAYREGLGEAGKTLSAPKVAEEQAKPEESLEAVSA